MWPRKKYNERWNHKKKPYRNPIQIIQHQEEERLHVLGRNLKCVYCDKLKKQIELDGSYCNSLDRTLL